MGYVEEIKKKDKLLAMIIRNDYMCEGVDFITPSEYSQQVAYMHHPKGKLIDAHVHNLVHRNVVMTQEVMEEPEKPYRKQSVSAKTEMC